MKKKKQVLSFRADEQITDALRKKENMTEFIQKALEEALKKDMNIIACPKCSGSGYILKKSK